VELNGRPTTVVGVLPADFRFAGADRADVYAPLAWGEEQWRPRGSHWLTAVGRLKAGVSPRAAQADLQTIADRIGKDFPEMQGGWGARVVPLHEAMVSGARPMLLVLMGAVGAVLLIGCANVANLTLARVTARQRGIAVRAAMGASRGELIRHHLAESVRHHLAESVVLGTAGGAAGLALAAGVSRALPALVPTEIPRIADAGVDWRVAAFTFAVSLAASVIAGLVPAWQGSRADPPRSCATATRARRRARRARGRATCCS
jgi:putative ABC transport system permease protein